MTTLFLAFLIGFVSGLRSLAPSAVTAWAAHLGWLKLQGTLALVGSPASVISFTVLALVELGADKWAKIPARTTIVPLLARVSLGGLTGACVAVAGGESAVMGGVLGGIGGVAGAFAGFQGRKRLVQAIGGKDFPIALLEDVVTIGVSLFVVTRFA